MVTHYSEVAQSVWEKAMACGRQPQEITLVAVSKTWPVQAIESVYQEGGREFGENRIQEALEKIPLLPEDCRWHFIGTLQSNKVGKSISHFCLIHSVDTPLLAQKISQASEARGVTTSILLQVNTSGEKTKQGLSPEEWESFLESINQLSHVRIEGLMTMAPYTEDEKVIRSCFRQLYQLRERWRKQMKDPAIFQHLSMGMSHDYLIAIEEGATLLRVGSAIYGG
jgi:PLP dependent protein